MALKKDINSCENSTCISYLVFGITEAPENTAEKAPEKQTIPPSHLASAEQTKGPGTQVSTEPAEHQHHVCKEQTEHPGQHVPEQTDDSDHVSAEQSGCSGKVSERQTEHQGSTVMHLQEGHEPESLDCHVPTVTLDDSGVILEGDLIILYLFTS